MSSSRNRPEWLGRSRFGIETICRQTNLCRIRNLVLLRKVWVRFHLNVVTDRHANGRLLLRLHRLRLTTHIIQHSPENLLCGREDPEAETADWKTLTLNERIHC